VATSTGTALQDLLVGAHLAGPDDLPGLIAAAGAGHGARETIVYVIDYDQVVLMPLTADQPIVRQPIAVDGTLAGRAFTEVTAYETAADDATTLWVPILDATERLGVMEMCFPPSRGVDDTLRDECFALGSLVAELLISRTVYGDSLERARRRWPHSVPAELQWTQLPPLTFATPRVAIAGALVPTHEVAGDSFDYAVNGDVAHIAIVDALGHGLEATLLSAVAIAAMRNARRSGLSLVDSVRSIDKHIAAEFGEDKFVTGIVGELDTRTGVWRWVNAGHPPALIVREGRVVKSLDAEVNPPLGLLGEVPEVGQERLQPGDRLLLHSDGVIEARNADGEFFGTQRLVDFVTREAAGERPAPETLRRLMLAILNHQGGELQDDATTLLVEWMGDEPRRLVAQTTPSLVS
jgi:serine phosphatase RsbU (regulator of sigma subunit)